MDQLGSDPAFVAGLENILRPMREKGASEQELKDMTEKAAAFYLQKQKPAEPPYPSSFGAIADLISSGAPLDASTVPGMRVIPDKINPEPPSESKIGTAPPKPWER